MVNPIYGYAEKYPSELNFKALNKRALQGDANAQYWMGRTYLEGRLMCRKDTTLAVKWLKLGAENGDIQAQHDLAEMYYNGLGVDVNRVDAIKLYKLCANNSSFRTNLKFEAQLFYAEALGKGLYEEKKDVEKALNLASKYWANSGWFTDRLYERLCAQQERLLGSLNYELSMDTDDTEKQKLLFDESAQHYGNAIRKMKTWVQKFYSGKLEDLNVQEKKFLVDGYAESYAYRGHDLFFINMITGGTDYTEVMNMYQEAIKWGNMSAMLRTADILYSGKGNIPADKAKAISLYTQLAVVSIEATYVLATYYYTEEKNYSLAFKYYKAIADDNSKIDNPVRADVLQHLSKMYLFGRGVEVDNDMADKYAKEAVKYGDVDSKAISDFLNQSILSSNSVTIAR
jgi:TPR repeat protein